MRYLTYEIGREMAQGQSVRYAELTCTPYTSVLPDDPDRGMAIEAYTEAIEDARTAAERLAEPLLQRPARQPQRLVAGRPMSESLPWIKMLIAFDLIFIVACTLAFPYTIEE